ncbi:replication initiation protein [Wielerella bovis]|uniref:replication initiation protein n=1 Tax=Wielerella bovis TaxID=2917790 RepID=UPI002018EF5B|nr:replication initiation protein [Wielerella bovis]ULJ59365.1 replication initiation protein [Wielerella bovis]
MKPIRYAKAIYHEMNKKLNGDLAFVGLLSHNPLHEQWNTVFLHTNTYSLDELAADLDLPTINELEKQKKYQELLKDGQLLGRNCSIFDQLRFWAYSAIRKNRHLSYEKWHNEVLSKAISFNTFTTPLALNEIRHIAKSVAKWVFKHDAECEKRFLERQSQKGKRSGVIRRERIESLKAIAYKWAIQNKMKQEDIAFFLNKS